MRPGSVVMALIVAVLVTAVGALASPDAVLRLSPIQAEVHTQAGHAIINLRI